MQPEKEEFILKLQESLGNRSFVRLVLGKYRGAEERLSIQIFLVSLGEGLNLVAKHIFKTKEQIENTSAKKIVELVNEQLGENFLSATVFTTRGDLAIDYSKKRIPQLHKKKAQYAERVIEELNRSKNRVIDVNAKYLSLLGVTSLSGRVKPGMYSKLQQIDKFIEIIDAKIRNSTLARAKVISAIDFGAGKSYLTFALYDHLERVLGVKASVLGVEARAELVEFSNREAKDCGFSGLSFKPGSIASYDYKGVDIVVALHACDTATDDAICKAVQAQASLIVLAPCCHKYLRRNIVLPADLSAAFKHGVLEERLAVSLTDALRALVLEACGYETKVFEFISSEHTDKNTMITAVKSEKTPAKTQRLEEIAQIRNKFGLSDFYLDLILAKELTN